MLWNNPEILGNDNYQVETRGTFQNTENGCFSELVLKKVR